MIESEAQAQAICMVTGDFRRGWELYEARWEVEPGKSHKPNFSQPLWRGEDLSGKTILLHSEQGYGDTIQFCRYAPLVAARGGRVVLRVLRPLHDLLTSLAGVSQLVVHGDPLPDFDVYCPLGSLPRIFGTGLAAVPADVPYLSAPAEARAKWAERFGAKGPLRVGIGGPVGAVAGLAIGGATGAAAAEEPTTEVTTYVTSNTVDPVYLDGEVVIGAGVPENVTIYEIPDQPDYRYAQINGQTVLVNPNDRQITYIYR